jgi:predicted GTPase
VKDIYLELDLNTEELVNSNMLLKNATIDSIIFADTMGVGHTTNKTSSKSSEYIDLSKNFSLLNESNIILLLDDATQTMNPGTLEQIKLLESYGLKEKIIFVYSKYN